MHPLPFSTITIDHVELFVRDRYETANWYKRVLALEVVPQYEHWAAHPDGPLMISGDMGRTKVALFEAKGSASETGCLVHRIAFRLDACGFFECVRHLAALDVEDHQGRRFSRDSVVDHDQAFSIYFSDPHGNRLEVTTYDYEAARTELARMRDGMVT